MAGLNDVIERETAALRIVELPEPASLPAARLKVEEAATRVRWLEEKADAVTRRLANDPSWSIWGHPLLGMPETERRALETRLDDLQRKIVAARGRLSTAKEGLRTAERKFQVERAKHIAAQSGRRTRAEGQIATVRVARAIIARNPRCAAWGTARLMQIAFHIRRIRAEAKHSDVLIDDWDLVPTFDLWGKPYLPPPVV